MPAITRIDQIPTSNELFPPSTHPDLQYPGSVHHGWNIGRQLMLRAVGSSLAKAPTGEESPERQQAVEHLRSLGHLDELTGPLIIALYVAAVLQPGPDVNTASLTPLAAEALADLGTWDIRAPLPDQLAPIVHTVRALYPCMPD